MEMQANVTSIKSNVSTINDNSFLDRAFLSLASGLTKLPELRRQVFVLSALKKAGHLLVSRELISKILSNQKKDGGWSDIPETVLAAYIINDHLDHRSAYDKGIEWLIKSRIRNTAWGNSVRDVPRIPVTGLLFALLPILVDRASFLWLENEWKKEMIGDTRLTYKGAFTLMAFAAASRSSVDPTLIIRTIEYLAAEQNKDGGFAPWRGHPIGSEPWSTGIVVIGLLSHPQFIDTKVIERSLEWLLRNQLPNGLWPCHYIDEGSAYCYWAASQALRYLYKAG